MLTLKQRIILEALFWLGLVVIVAAVAGPVALIVLIVGIISFASVYFRYLTRRSLFKKLRRAINVHMGVLAERRAQLVHFDAYGVPNLEPWWGEISFFLTDHVEPLLTRGERAALKSEDADVIAFVDRSVTAGIKVQPKSRPPDKEQS